MADPAPDTSSEPVRDIPAPRASPEAQMSALEGQPAELSPPDAENSSEREADAKAETQPHASPMAPFDNVTPRVEVARDGDVAQDISTKPAQLAASDTMETPVSPPAPSDVRTPAANAKEPHIATSQANPSSNGAPASAPPPAPASSPTAQAQS